MTSPRALVGNATDEKQVKNGQNRESLNFAQADDDLREILAMGAGRRFLWKHIGDCQMFAVLQPSSTDASLWFHNGKRDIGLTLMQDCQKADKELFLLMQRESLEREQPNARNNKRAKRDDTSHTLRDDEYSDENGG